LRGKRAGKKARRTVNSSMGRTLHSRIHDRPGKQFCTRSRITVKDNWDRDGNLLQGDRFLWPGEENRMDIRAIHRATKRGPDCKENRVDLATQQVLDGRCWGDQSYFSRRRHQGERRSTKSALDFRKGEGLRVGESL